MRLTKHKTVYDCYNDFAKAAAGVVLRSASGGAALRSLALAARTGQALAARSALPPLHALAEEDKGANARSCYSAH